MNAQNSRVQDLCHSVQLNVNNPHFLIIQGRITKVLNMKPPEILSTIEEAAGTKMYESKKQSAPKTIEKKDAKLREIDSLLAEEIAPMLNKLKDERASYLEYQKIQRELEHVTKLLAAYRFVCAEEGGERLAEIEQNLKSKQFAEAKFASNLKNMENSIKTKEKKKNELQKNSDEHVPCLATKEEELTKMADATK